MAMSEEQQKPHLQQMHIAIMDAIHKYEDTTGWAVTALELATTDSFSALNINVVPQVSQPGAS